MCKERFELDKTLAYRLVDVTDREGKSKLGSDPFYGGLEGYVAIGLRCDRMPNADGLYRARFDFVQNDAGGWIRRGIHTSAVENVEQTETGITVQTRNSIYVFEKATLKKTPPCEEKDVLELYLSVEEDYHFAKGFYWDENGKSKELFADVHVGTFVDTVLIGLADESVWGEYLCRYYYEKTVRFYDTLYKQQDYSTPMIIHNTSKSVDLVVEFEGYDRRWTIAPLEHKRIIPFTPFGEDE